MARNFEDKTAWNVLNAILLTDRIQTTRDYIVEGYIFFSNTCNSFTLWNVMQVELEQEQAPLSLGIFTIECSIFGSIDGKIHLYPHHSHFKHFYTKSLSVDYTFPNVELCWLVMTGNLWT